jgi:hypothetical protein
VEAPWRAWKAEDWDFLVGMVCHSEDNSHNSYCRGHQPRFRQLFSTLLKHTFNFGKISFEFASYATYVRLQVDDAND